VTAETTISARRVCPVFRQLYLNAINCRKPANRVNAVASELFLHLLPTLPAPIEVDTDLVRESLIDYSARFVNRSAHGVEAYQDCLEAREA